MITREASPSRTATDGVLLDRPMFDAKAFRLSDEQAEALRRKADAEHRSMQQVALAAIDAFLRAIAAKESQHGFADAKIWRVEHGDGRNKNGRKFPVPAAP